MLGSIAGARGLADDEADRERRVGNASQKPEGTVVQTFLVD